MIVRMSIRVIARRMSAIRRGCGMHINVRTDARLCYNIRRALRCEHMPGTERMSTYDAEAAGV